jgi:hypothetical protein
MSLMNGHGDLVVVPAHALNALTDVECWLEATQREGLQAVLMQDLHAVKI